jgi:hypothetical protein
LHPVELRQPVDREFGESDGDVGADCAVVLIFFRNDECGFE